jgi:hypothetical protein
VAGAAFVCATAVLATGLRLRAAGLPFGHGLFVVPVGHSLRVAVILIAVAFAAVLVSCAAAYGIAWWHWEFHGRDWDEIVARQGVANAWNALNDDAAHHRAPLRRAARDARAEQVHSDDRERGLADEPSVTENAPGRMLLQIIVGFNVLAVAGTVGLAVGRLVSEFAIVVVGRRAGDRHPGGACVRLGDGTRRVRPRGRRPRATRSTARSARW